MEALNQSLPAMDRKHGGNCPQAEFLRTRNDPCLRSVRGNSPTQALKITLRHLRYSRILADQQTGKDGPRAVAMVAAAVEQGEIKSVEFAGRREAQRMLVGAGPFF